VRVLGPERLDRALEELVVVACQGVELPEAPVAVVVRRVRARVQRQDGREAPHGYVPRQHEAPGAVPDQPLRGEACILRVNS
jgi:hypothetical protein